MDKHERTELKPEGSLRLWFALLGAGVLWFAAQGIAYVLVPWSCSHDTTWPLHLISLAALAGITFAGLAGYQIWRAAGGRWSDDRPDRAHRNRFIAELGMGFSALFALLLAGMWIAVIVLGPCIPLPRVPFTPDALLRPGNILLAHPGAALEPHDLWSAWSTDPAIWLALLWGGVFYGAGLRAAPRRIRLRTTAFVAGSMVLVLALLSPLHALSEVLFSAHMAQHTLLIAVAAPLIVWSRPVLVSLWALPRQARRTLAHHSISRLLARGTRFTPVQAFALHGAALWIWHLPALYEASLTSDAVHALQHATFFLTGAAFWAAVFDARSRGATHGSGVLYTFGTAVHTSALGALLTLAPVTWYPRYAATTNAWGLTPLEDQQIAGLIMWVPGGLLYTVLAILLLANWLRAAEQRSTPRWLTALSAR